MTLGESMAPPPPPPVDKESEVDLSNASLASLARFLRLAFLVPKVADVEDRSSRAVRRYSAPQITNLVPVVSRLLPRAGRYRERRAVLISANWGEEVGGSRRRRSMWYAVNA